MITDIALVIPAYCPDEKMTSLVLDLKQYFSAIFVVNDGSPDDYDSVFDRLCEIATVIKHPQNLGKGAALKSGFAAITQTASQGDIFNGVITVDADGQHLTTDVLEIARFAQKNANFCALGVRDFSENVPLRSKVGNIVTVSFLKLFYGLALSDSQTGLRYLPVNMLPDLMSLPGQKYEFELQCLLLLQKKRLTVAQIPISTVYIDANDSSHFRPVRDSIRIYSVFFKFSLSSILSFALDIILFSLIFAFFSDVWLATITARVISGVANFHLNRQYVFARRKMGSVSREGIKYGALWLFLLAASALSVDFASNLLEKEFVVPVKIAIDSVLFFLSFQIQRRLIFR